MDEFDVGTEDVVFARPDGDAEMQKEKETAKQEKKKQKKHKEREKQKKKKERNKDRKKQQQKKKRRRQQHQHLLTGSEEDSDYDDDSDACSSSDSDDDSEEEDDHLDLHALLTLLDGGLPTPGRLIVCCTNRVDVLDEALVRPGRLTQIRLHNLDFSTFKEMIKHYRPHQARGSTAKISTKDLWTPNIDQLGLVVMHIFSQLNEMRQGDLDTSSIGLSPALLAELCLQSQTLEELFRKLQKQMEEQLGKIFGTQKRPASKHVESIFDGSYFNEHNSKDDFSGFKSRVEVRDLLTVGAPY